MTLHKCPFCNWHVEIIGTAEAAEICGDVGVHAIIKAIKRGLIVAVKIGGPGQRGVHAMLKSEAERYKRERRSVGRPKKEPSAPTGGLK